MTRSENVCFQDEVRFFGGGLIIMIPKPNVSISLETVEKFINSDSFKKNYIYSGRFKIGHKQLCNALLPFFW